MRSGQGPKKKKRVRAKSVDHDAVSASAPTFGGASAKTKRNSTRAKPSEIVNNRDEPATLGLLKTHIPGYTYTRYCRSSPEIESLAIIGSTSALDIVSMHPSVLIYINGIDASQFSHVAGQKTCMLYLR